MSIRSHSVLLGKSSSLAICAFEAPSVDVADVVAADIEVRQLGESLVAGDERGVGEIPRGEPDIEAAHPSARRLAEGRQQRRRDGGRRLIGRRLVRVRVPA